MQKFIVLFLSMIASFTILSQTNAITETGDKVILYDDGTWEYIEEMAEAEEAIPVNPNSFTKSEDADFLLKSKNMNVKNY